MPLGKLLSILFACAFVAADARAQKLGIGDPAPPLKVSRWAKGEPLKSFEPERVYVVEFWATWCVPCRKSIPHLTEVQSKFEARGVSLIAVSVWEDNPQHVQPFVDQWGDAMGYRVALDEVYEGAKASQGTMARTWMRAANEESIPTAFIVDQRGRVAWIGDSLQIEAPLTQVLDGTWDLQAAKLAHQKRARVNQLHREFRKEVDALAWPKVLAICEELEKLDPGSVFKVGPRRFQALLALGRDAEGYAFAKSLVEGAFKDEALHLNWIAWIVVDPDAGAQIRRDLDFALAVAKRADELSKHEHPAILDTLAVCYFEKGEVAKAIEVQSRAVELAKGTHWSGELEKRLAKFRQTEKLALKGE